MTTASKSADQRQRARDLALADTDALEGEDREAARQIIHHFVAKIVIKRRNGNALLHVPAPG